MYSVIKTRVGKVLILSVLINEVLPLFQKCIKSINHQNCEYDLLCWLTDIFSDEFTETYGEYSTEYLKKFALCVLNARCYLIQDSEKFCQDFNREGVGLEIGFDKTYYPIENGHWYNKLEFSIVANG